MEETKNCPYCGEEILAIAKKCKHCGEWLNQDKSCPICGETIPADATVCPVCGEDIGVDSAQPVAQPAAPQPHVEKTRTIPTPQPAPQQDSRPIPPPTIGAAPVYSHSAEPTQDETKGFFEYYFKENFLNLSFSGNTPKRQYWMGVVAFTVVNFIFWGIVMALVVMTESIGMLIAGYVIYGIFSLVALPTAVRRLHDVGKSGWYILISFIPLIGSILLLIALAGDGKEESKEVETNTMDKIIFALAVAGIISMGVCTLKVNEIVSGAVTEWMFGYNPYEFSGLYEDSEDEGASDGDTLAEDGTEGSADDISWVGTQYNFSVPMDFDDEGTVFVEDAPADVQIWSSGSGDIKVVYWSLPSWGVDGFPDEDCYITPVEKITSVEDNGDGTYYGSTDMGNRYALVVSSIEGDVTIHANSFGVVYSSSLSKQESDIVDALKAQMDGWKISE